MNPSLPKSMLPAKFRLLTKKLAQIQYWYKGVSGRIWNLKNRAIFWIYWIFKLLSQQVFSRIVGNFQNINVNNSLGISAMVGFYVSIRRQNKWFDGQSSTYNLGRNCWNKIENLFFSGKTPFSPNQCCFDDETWLDPTLI